MPTTINRDAQLSTLANLVWAAAGRFYNSWHVP